MHRLFALLTSLSMLHLMLVGGDPACASHRMSVGSAHGTMQMPGTMHHEGGQMPAPTRCCEAMTSCGATAAVSCGERPVAPDHLSVGTPPHVLDVLLSVLTAPEPPPPKA